MLITLEPHGIFNQILHTYACQHCLTTGTHKAFFIDEALLGNSSAGRGKLMKVLVTLEHGIFGSNVHTFFLIFNIVRHWYAKR